VSGLLFNPLRIVGGTAVGVGVGQAVADAISPVTRELANEAWAKYLSMPVSVIEAAAVVASGERSRAWGIEEATKTGFDEERFNALVDMLDTAPDLATLYDLYNRNLISEGELRQGARKQYIEAQWADALVTLAEKILTPAEVAQAWQRGYISEADAEREAALSGVNAERARIQRESAGLPPPPETAMQMLRRGIIGPDEFEQMIREGNTKTKYTDEYLQLRERVLSGPEWAGLWLRGWATEAEAKAGGALEGWSAEEMDLLYLNRGRPATGRQIHIGYARGATLPGAANERAAFERGVRQSNIRTEYTDLLWASRHTYPSAFVLRALTEDGTFTQADAERILIESGWVPEFAEKAAAKWAGAGSAGPGTKWADRARSRLFTAAHSDYLDGNADEADARAMLTAVGVPDAEQTTILNLWNLERNRTRRDLTQSQIIKLYKKDIWPREQAQAALEDIGMEPDDASDLLDAK
jgi:hypothetical protein